MKKVVCCVIFFFAAVTTTFFVTSCHKSNLGPEYEGAWSNRLFTAKLSISKGQGVYGSVTQNGKTTSASGTARTSGNTLIIGGKKISMQAPPTDVPLGQGVFNHYIVLDNDTLFKSPIITGSNYFCSDGIQNNGETGVDCGGKCGDCGTIEDCEDAYHTPGETGVDCGGVCEPCATSACNVTLGFGENGYLASGSAALQDSTVNPDDISDEVVHKLVLNFPAGSACKSYEISFYNEVFLFMPVNMTELLKTYNSSVVRKLNSCLVEIVMSSGARLKVQPGQKVYIVKNGETDYNIKFCNLEADKTGTFNLNTNFSANVNFQLHRL